MRHKTIQKAIKASRGNRKEVIEKISKEIRDKLSSVKTMAEITGREKKIQRVFTEKCLKIKQALIK